MIRFLPRLRRLILPAAVIAGVVLVHFVWLGLWPEKNPVQARWVSAPAASVSWLTRYIEARNYWIGFSYGLSLAFATVAFRRYREGRFCTAGRFAVGGVTWSGVLSVVGCYLMGCCGSPMLAVYLNLFGAAFIPLAKPLMFGLTALSVAIAWWWMNRKMVKAQSLALPGSRGDAPCPCPLCDQSG